MNKAYFCNMTKVVSRVLLIVLICLVVIVEIDAQCPMCRMAAESNLANGGSEGKGLNKGILYMLSMPYILVSTVGIIWWRNNRAVKAEEESIETTH